MVSRPPELITTGFLAREFTRSSVDIRRALDRLGIQPAAVAGNVNVYHPDVVPVLRRVFNTEDAKRGICQESPA